MKTIREGRAVVEVPESSLTKAASTFYNPAMEHQRDITIAALRVYRRQASWDLDILDPLAASGVRGIRIAKEVEGVRRVVFNDLYSEAVRMIRKNITKNSLKCDFDVRNEDANVLMTRERSSFDYIDIDPFGSPAPYLDSAGTGLKRKSFLGVTATDGGALSGVFSRTCLRRYGVMTAKTDFPKELGARTLATATMLSLAKHDMSFEPVYSHGNHYFRVLGLVRAGAGRADRLLEQVEFVSYCPSCLNRKIGIEKECDYCRKKMVIIGPLWTGKMEDREFCGKMMSEFLSLDFKGGSELDMCMRETEAPFYYDLHELCSVHKRQIPGTEELLRKLKDAGFRASRTGFSRLGIRTDAGIKDIIRML